MKNSLFALIALALGLFACKKQEDEKPQPPVYPATEYDRKIPLNLRLTGFLKKVEELPANARLSASAARDTSLRYKVAHLYYQVYNGNNLAQPIRTWHQTPSNSGADFGLIRDSLPAGNYVVTLLAAEVPLNFTSDTFSMRQAYRHANGDTVYPVTDVYRAKLNIQHPSDSAAAPWKEVSLNRVISQVQVMVEDLPVLTSYANVSVKLLRPSTGFYLNDGTGVWGPASRFSIFYGAGANTYGTYVMPSPTGMPYSIEILARHKITGDTVAFKTIHGIECGNNRRITLTGKLLPPPGDEAAAFGISLNQTWLPEQVITY